MLSFKLSISEIVDGTCADKVSMSEEKSINEMKSFTKDKTWVAAYLKAVGGSLPESRGWQPD